MTVICVREQCQYDRNGVCNNECLMNPIYHKLAQIAYDTVYQTMLDGEKTHPANEWQNVDIMEHFRHALDHLAGWELEEKDEDHLAHAITRLIMIRYLEANHENI